MLQQIFKDSNQKLCLESIVLFKNQKHKQKYPELSYMRTQTITYVEQVLITTIIVQNNILNTIILILTYKIMMFT